MTTSPTRNNDGMAGTARLLARRAPGETFSCEAIARECGVHKRTIQNTESRALYKVAKRLHFTCPEAVQQILGSPDKIKAFFKKLNPSIVGPSGRESLYTKKHFGPVPSGRGRMTLDQVRRYIYATRPDRIPSIREKQAAFHAKQALNRLAP